jgi:predicted negative regulator of RcsB-dependent stress response
MKDINIFWFIFNIIPVEPLDGGKILRYLLETTFKEKGFKASLAISILFSVLGSYYYFSIHALMFAVILFVLGIKNIQLYLHPNYIKKSHPSNNFTLYNEGVRASLNNEKEKAKAIFKKLLKAKASHIKILATESLANILYEENKPEKAYKMLLNIDPKYLKKGKCTLCKLAYEKKNFSIIEKYSREIYEIESSYEIALLNSKSFAALNKPAISGGWLHTASLFENVKKEHLKAILQDKIYDVVREHNSFKEYAKKIHE